ncbi:MAG: hypothetical protein ACXVHX_27485, partial [Solirubrobacteraceae bacterium]
MGRDQDRQDRRYGERGRQSALVSRITAGRCNCQLTRHERQCGERQRQERVAGYAPGVVGSQLCRKRAGQLRRVPQARFGVGVTGEMVGVLERDAQAQAAAHPAVGELVIESVE